MVNFADIEAARRRAGDAMRETPCRRGEWLSKTCQADVFLKMENLQHTGSFKARGALNRILMLSDAERRAGVVAASAGNHAQGVAYHATRLGIPSTIVMPETTPLVKVSRTAEYGAEVILEGENYDAAFEYAEALSQKTGAILIHAYDDDDVIAGQGTLALEIIEQNPYLEAVVVPVGGGGLISGVALAIKKVKPQTRIIGVEAAALPSMAAAIAAGSPVKLPAARTIADGIAVRRVGQRCLDICRDLVDEWVTVADDDVARAILYLLEKEKVVAEGAGAAGVAALLTGRISDIAGKNVVVVICGGNIDVTMIARIIERGLVETGRLSRLEVRMPDRPGALAELLRCVADTRSNVMEVHHERAFQSGAVGEVRVELKVETRGAAHMAELLERLRENNFVAQRV